MDTVRLYHGKRFDVKYPAIKSQIKLSRIITGKDFNSKNRFG